MMSGTPLDRIALQLPGWLEPFLVEWTGSLDGVEARMRLAVALSRENLDQGTGGPFGAVVVAESDNRLLGAGVNLVTSAGLSVAHAEIVALSSAQHRLADWNLAKAGPVQLVTSCQPCAMCFGAVPWSGVSSLAWGARKQDAEAAGFDEGDKPADWEDSLRRRGIEVHSAVLSRDAAAVLEHYSRTDGTIYHPHTHSG